MSDSSVSQTDVLPHTYHVTHWNKMMNEATFTFRVDEALKKEFTTVAKKRDRTDAQLLREFIQQQEAMPKYDAWFHRQVQTGLNAANANHLLPSVEVEARLAARRAATHHKIETSD